MDDNNKSEHVFVGFYQRIETSERVNESGHATEDLDQTTDSAANTCQQMIASQINLDQISDSTANTCQQTIASQIYFDQTSDSAANTCQENIASRIDFGVEHTQLVKCLIDGTQAEDSVNKSHVKVFEYNINNISETKISTENENHKEDTSESNDATNMDNQSNDNELCQQTETNLKSEMEDNIEKVKFQTVNYIENEKSQMEGNIETEKNQIVDHTETEKSEMEDHIEVEKSKIEENIETENIEMEENIETEKSQIEDNIETECSKLEYHMDMQRPPSHITVANWSRKNTPTKKTKSSDSVISEEVNALSRQDSKKKLVNNSDIDNITEKVTGIGNTKFCMNNESTSDSLNTKDENEYRLASNSDEGIKYKRGDRLSEGVPDDDTDSNALNTSSQSIKHEETFKLKPGRKST
ncbi:Hypothetical predicted protein [Mytilus galloprovincialis]|uniref:Uncharacterized protein n=1 Tax=Mytilus galloprovincialis TaxID=29158 RepID=A0A8B6BPG8_MYTGA|nr:Hypothetical predicted protein [Mytilus galloprovincialis]